MTLLSEKKCLYYRTGGKQGTTAAIQEGQRSCKYYKPWKNTVKCEKYPCIKIYPEHEGFKKIDKYQRLSFRRKK